jgi:hypothetical protein
MRDEGQLTPLVEDLHGLLEPGGRQFVVGVERTKQRAGCVTRRVVPRRRQTLIHGLQDSRPQCRQFRQSIFRQRIG